MLIPYIIPFHSFLVRGIILLAMASVSDKSDPQGTRRPLEEPGGGSNTTFNPAIIPGRDVIIKCPDAANPLTIFQLFFPNDQLQIIVNNTNKNAAKSRDIPKLCSFSRAKTAIAILSSGHI